MESSSLILCVLIAIFGIGSWIDINGLWVETPLLVQSLPEKWALPSYLVMIIQIANIGPLLYLLLNRLSKGSISERPVIYIILSVGLASCILLGLFWDHTLYFIGSMRSIPLLILALCLAIVDCTSSLVFLPYLAAFPQTYLTALYVGEGCSGLIPGIVGLIQGIGGETKCVNSTDANGTSSLQPVFPSPLFTVQDYFFFLGFMLLSSLTAFSLIDCHPKFKTYRAFTHCRQLEPEPIHQSEDVHIQSVGSPVVQYIESREPMLNNHQRNEHRPVSKFTCVILLLLVTWINALSNGFLPSLQSYASIPYGNVPYHLAVTLSNIVNPVACSLTFFWKLKKLRWIGLLTLIGTIDAVYLSYLAFLSPNPPLNDVVVGKIVMVTCWVLITGVFSYIKTMIGLLLQNNGKTYLMCCGLFTQVGSFFGALSSFLLVNVLQLLQQKSVC